MPLNSLGQISLGGTTTGESIALELGLGATSTISLGSSSIYGIAGFTSASNVDMGSFRGKVGRKSVTNIGTPNTGTYYNLVLQPSIVPGYIAGKTDIVYTIPAGVQVGSWSTGTAAFTVTGFTSGDTITIYNYGYIIGRGGNGGRGRDGYEGTSGRGGAGTNGGIGIQIGFQSKIYNYGTIAGGGGGGGGGGAMVYYNGGYAGGGGGGGGAGIVGGSGGGGGKTYANYWDGLSGAGGTAGAGGAGGRSSDSRFGTTLAGGNGGGPGASGGAGDTPFGDYLGGGPGGVGGAAGVGNNLITWQAWGTVYGGIAP